MKSRDQLREEWRIAAIAATHAEDKAARAKQGREIYLDQLIETLIEQAEEAGKKLSQAAAERMARTSDGYKRYLRKMHDLRLEAELLRIAAEDKNRVYWDGVSSEATHRAEMRMAGAA